MAKIKTFELDRWSEPDEKRRVRHIGMADAKETFDRLQTHLELKGLLPDEYFLFSDELTASCLNLTRRSVFPILGPAKVSIWTFPWPAATKMASAIFRTLLPARHWEKLRTTITGCSASLPNVP